MQGNLDGEMDYLWWAIDHEGDALVSNVIRSRDKAAALSSMKKAVKHHYLLAAIITDGLRSYGTAMTSRVTLIVKRSAAGQSFGGK